MSYTDFICLFIVCLSSLLNNPETCILRGEIVNVSVDERVLDQNGKVDASKVIPVIFDPFNNNYLKVGEKVGNAFSDGKALK